MGAGDSNSGPHVRMASTLTPERAPWLPTLSALFLLGFLLLELLCSSEIHLVTRQGAPLSSSLPTPPAQALSPAYSLGHFL